MGLTLHLYNGRLDPVDFALKAGTVINEQLNETRDSGTAIIRVKGYHLDIQPFDYVVIDGTSCGYEIEPRTFVVDSFSEAKVGYDAEEEYEITISLFSQMKEMERVTCPSRAITAPADGTSRSVLYYLDEFLDEYAPKHRIVDPQDATKVILANAWKLAVETQERFAFVDCPEFQWNNPTLAEVVTDLMQVADCIPTIKGNYIHFIDLKKTNGPVYSPDRLIATRQQNSNDYNQTLTMNLKNAIGSKPTRIVEFTSFRNRTESVQTTSNLQIITQKPIYAIKSIKAIVRERYSDPQYAEKRITTLDLTGNVKEQDAYNVLDPTTSGDFGAASYYPTAKRERQIANAYYKRGGNVIEGWSKQFQLALGAQTAIEFIIDHEMMAEQGHWINADGIDYRDIMFSVEYETLAELTVSVGRKLPLRNSHTASFDNQGSSYVDLNQQGIFEYAKANRLGNRIVELSGTFFAESDVPSVGQTYEGSIIFSTEAQYFDDCILFHGYATDDYVLANYFVAVRAKRRSWAIASGSEALTRHENAKYYLEFSHRRKKEVMGNYELRNDAAAAFLSPLYDRFNDDAIKLCAFQTRGGTIGSSFLPSAGYYIVDCSAEAVGMSLCFSFQFTDNYSAGSKIEEQTLDNNTKRLVNKMLPYADDRGEFSRYDVQFMSYYDPADDAFIWPSVYVDTAGAFMDDGFVPFQQETMWSDMVQKARAKPYSPSIVSSQVELTLSRQAHKDNREIFGATLQVEFCADDPKIIIPRRFVDKQKYIRADQYPVAGLKLIAATYVQGASQLPEPSEKYVGVGFLVNPNYPGYAPRFVYYSCRQTGDVAYEWRASELQEGEKLVYIEGYRRTQSDAGIGVAGWGRRLRVYEYGFNADGDPSIYDEKLAVRAVLVDEPLTDEAGEIDSPSFTSYNVAVNKHGDQAEINVATALRAEARRTNAAAWALIDSDNKVILGVNLTEDRNVREFSLWLNILKIRSSRVSRSIAERQVIEGTIAVD